MKVWGAQFTIATQESGLWWDSDNHHSGEGKPGGGLVFKLRAGQVVRPWGHANAAKPNQWWFPRGVFRFKFPLPFLPYLSLAIGRYGFYVGFKEYEFEPHYATWWPAGYARVQTLCPSASFRRTRIR
jgi:hypothetical protein